MPHRRVVVPILEKDSKPLSALGRQRTPTGEPSTWCIAKIAEHRTTRQTPPAEFAVIRSVVLKARLPASRVKHCSERGHSFVPAVARLSQC